MDFKKEKHKGFNVTTYSYKKTESKIFESLSDGDCLKNFGIFIPLQAIKATKAKRFFGWYILFMKKWVGVRKYTRIVPVRQDKIIDFLFFRFVKPINNNVPQWKYH